MNNQELFAKFMGKLKREALLKSLVIAAAVAFGGSFIAAFVCWFLSGVDGLWVSIGVFGVLFVALSLILYFAKFRPTWKDVARRLDRLGLDERMITMTELEGVDTIMAVHQRESAVNALGTVSNKMLTVAVSVISCVALAITGVLGISMTTVEALSYRDKGPSGSDFIGQFDDRDVYFNVRYVINYYDGSGNLLKDQTGCAIDGNDEQIVLRGGDAEPVYAYSEDDMGDEWFWYFYGWYDFNPTNLVFGDPISTDAFREDLGISEESVGELTVDEDGNFTLTFYAAFVQATFSEDGDTGAGEPEDGEPADGDAPSDMPSEGDEDEEGEAPGGGTSGDEGVIIDGSQDFRDRLEEYYAMYEQAKQNGEPIPDYLKKIIETYYGIIL